MYANLCSLKMSNFLPTWSLRGLSRICGRRPRRRAQSSRAAPGFGAERPEKYHESWTIKLKYVVTLYKVRFSVKLPVWGMCSCRSCWRRWWRRSCSRAWQWRRWPRWRRPCGPGSGGAPPGWPGIHRTCRFATDSNFLPVVKIVLWK